MNPFDYLNSINLTKKNLIVDEETEKAYLPFIVNRSLSNFMDTILLANEMNQLAFVDKKLQYDFYMAAVKKRKRFAKWAKKISSEELEAVKFYYNYSDTRAAEILPILPKEHVNKIVALYKDANQI